MNKIKKTILKSLLISSIGLVGCNTNSKDDNNSFNYSNTIKMNCNFINTEDIDDDITIICIKEVDDQRYLMDKVYINNKGFQSKYSFDLTSGMYTFVTINNNKINNWKFYLDEYDKDDYNLNYDCYSRIVNFEKVYKNLSK